MSSSTQYLSVALVKYMNFTQWFNDTSRSNMWQYFVNSWMDRKKHNKCIISYRSAFLNMGPLFTEVGFGLKRVTKWMAQGIGILLLLLFQIAILNNEYFYRSHSFDFNDAFINRAFCVFTVTELVNVFLRLVFIGKSVQVVCKMSLLII